MIAAISGEEVFIPDVMQKWCPRFAVMTECQRFVPVEVMMSEAHLVQIHVTGSSDQGSPDGFGRMDGSIVCFWSASADDRSSDLDQFWRV